MNEVFENLGYKGYDYTKYTLDVKNKIDVIHDMYTKENGEFCLRDNTKYEDLINEYKIISYYYSNK